MAKSANTNEGSRLVTKQDGGNSAKTGTPRLDRSQAAVRPQPSSGEGAPKKRPSASEVAPKKLFAKGAKDSGASKPSNKKKRSGSHRGLWATAALFLVLAFIVGLLSWNQWLRYDDAADFRGTWLVEGTSEVLTFTESSVVLTEEVSYGYTLDTFAKKITFTFENYQGYASYDFSPERNEVVITEQSAETGEDVATKLVRP